MKQRRGNLKTQPNYILSIRLAEAQINELKIEALSNPIRMDRFLRLYCSDKNTENNFIDTA
jgi:hypothetical protein